MPPVPSEEFLERFRAALRLEIRAEMGRQSLSANALATRSGESAQYVNMRILSGNRKTGRFVDITVSDLAKFAGALEIDPVVLVQRATATAGDELALKRAQRDDAAQELSPEPGYLVASEEAPAPADESDET